MPKDSFTFALEGDVTLGNFAGALNEFRALLGNLSKEVGINAAIEWMVEELYAGSAIATFHGVFEDARVIENEDLRTPHNTAKKLL